MKQNKFMLNGEWTMSKANGSVSDFNKVQESEKYRVQVQIPGSVLSGLTENGRLADPFYRSNEYDTLRVLKDDYQFSRRFIIEKKENFIYELMCDGIDTIGDIYINGTMLANVSNMHTRYQFNCTELLRNGENTIQIYLYSAVEQMKQHVPEPGKEIHYLACGTIPGNQYIRKAHSMFGWDWGPQLPDIGIWRDIYIREYETASLEDVRIRQEHVITAKDPVTGRQNVSRVRVTLEETVKLADGRRLTLEDAVKEIPELRIEADILTPEGSVIPVMDQAAVIDNPELWWPNGYGSQPLYTVRVSLYLDDSIQNIETSNTAEAPNTAEALDIETSNTEAPNTEAQENAVAAIGTTELNSKEYRIGLRTLTVSREKDEWGEEFAFCVNGVKIFAKGANYIPEDCIYSRITKERQEFLLDSSVDAGFNCMRIWGGGYYPSDLFYDMCDEKGLIVWQDFMYACNIYELTEELRDSIIEETRDNVRRLRHHASLGLWCGNNEMESAWDHWYGFCDHSEALRQDYLTMFEELIPGVMREEDDTTFYWPSSPSSGGGIQNPDSNDVGDRHYWDVWHGEKPFQDYENYYFRFCSEFGFQSWPSLETIETFTLPEDRNIFTAVMESHQKNGTANAKILHYIAENFLYPKDFASLLYVSQVLQGIAIKSGVEHWRRNRGRCMGSIYWQINDNWPVASWSSIDYIGRWKALQYMARQFYAGVLGSVQKTGNVVTPFVQNETFEPVHTTLQLYVKDMDCNILYEKHLKLQTEPLGVQKSESIDLGGVIQGREDSAFLEAVFTHSDGTVSRQVEPFVPYKHLQIKETQINVQAERNGEELILHLQSKVFAPFVEITVLKTPVILSDNFFHLTDSGVHTITAKLPAEYAREKERMPQIQVRSLRDSYSF